MPRTIVVYRGCEDISCVLETARRHGFFVVVKEGDEYMALGPWGVSHDPNETTALIIRWAERMGHGEA